MDYFIHLNDYLILEDDSKFFAYSILKTDKREGIVMRI